MYNMILVDDEEIVLTGIQKVFKMSDYQFRIVGTFSNPLKALEELSDLSPDLIITDIKMPQMNGLEFSTKAREILPKVEIVILSGYDNFAFAQSAVKLGVSDYILKPVKKKDFESMLVKMYGKISKREQIEKEFKRMQSAVKINYHVMRNKFFEKLADPDVQNQLQIQKLYDELGFQFKDSPFILIKFIIYEMSPENDFISATEEIINEFSLRIKEYGECEVFYTDEYLYFYLYNISKDRFERKEFLQNVLSYTMMKIQNMLSLRVGISQIYDSMFSLFYAISDCDEFILTENLDKSDSGNILGNLHQANQDLRLPYTGLESVFHAISSNDKKLIHDSIEDIFDLPDTSIYRNYMYSLAVILLIRMSHLQNKYKIGNQIITPALLDSRQLLKNHPTAEQVKKLLISKSNSLADEISFQNNQSSSKTIVAALQYIDKHFHENISLSDVAENVFISKNYLCDLFKKELGTTFIDYVTVMRIEKAKYLLTQTNMKMYEIAKQVGCNDYAYFSQIFKRYTGVTLSDYRKSV